MNRSRFANPDLRSDDERLSPSQRGDLFLREHGFRTDGRRMGDPENGRSVPTIYTPVGGAPRGHGQRFAPGNR